MKPVNQYDLMLSIAACKISDTCRLAATDHQIKPCVEALNAYMALTHECFAALRAELDKPNPDTVGMELAMAALRRTQGIHDYTTDFIQDQIAIWSLTLDTENS